MTRGRTRRGAGGSLQPSAPASRSGSGTRRRSLTAEAAGEEEAPESESDRPIATRGSSKRAASALSKAAHDEADTEDEREEQEGSAEDEGPPAKRLRRGSHDDGSGQRGTTGRSKPMESDDQDPLTAVTPGAKGQKRGGAAGRGRGRGK